MSKLLILKTLCFLLLCINKLNVKAQNVQGIFTGNYGKSFMMIQPQKIDLDLYFINDSTISGTSHLFYKGNQYEHYKIKGKYNKKDSTLSFVEDSTIGVKVGFLNSTCKGDYSMKLVVSNDTLLRFEGIWKDRYRGIFRCPKSTVWFEKKLSKKIFEKIPEKKIDKLQRQEDIQSLIEINKQDADSIKIDLYDNGVIDGDTVSVYLNDELLLNKQQISTTPISLTIKASLNTQYNKIKLIAESLGSLPPCTATMIVYIKNKRYEVSLSSDFNKNAVAMIFIKD